MQVSGQHCTSPVHTGPRFFMKMESGLNKIGLNWPKNALFIHQSNLNYAKDAKKWSQKRQEKNSNVTRNLHEK